MNRVEVFMSVRVDGEHWGNNGDVFLTYEDDKAIQILCDKMVESLTEAIGPDRARRGEWEAAMVPV